MSAAITLSRVTRDDATLLDRLWQFYELESSFWSGEDIDESGRFNSLSDFMERLGDPDSFDWAYLIRYEGRLAGLLLVGHQNLRGRSIMESPTCTSCPGIAGAASPARWSDRSCRTPKSRG
jgi:hypothetical protein